MSGLALHKEFSFCLAAFRGVVGGQEAAMWKESVLLSNPMLKKYYSLGQAFAFLAAAHAELQAE